MLARIGHIIPLPCGPAITAGQFADLRQGWVAANSRGMPQPTRADNVVSVCEAHPPPRSRPAAIRHSRREDARPACRQEPRATIFSWRSWGLRVLSALARHSEER